MTVDDKGIKDSWKEYTEKLMNEENERDHKISAGVKEGPANCIRTAVIRDCHAVASTGPYANNLNHTSNPTLNFLQAGCSY